MTQNTCFRYTLHIDECVLFLEEKWQRVCSSKRAVLSVASAVRHTSGQNAAGRTCFALLLAVAHYLRMQPTVENSYTSQAFIPLTLSALSASTVCWLDAPEQRLLSVFRFLSLQTSIRACPRVSTSMWQVSQ